MAWVILGLSIQTLLRTFSRDHQIIEATSFQLFILKKMLPMTSLSLDDVSIIWLLLDGCGQTLGRSFLTSRKAQAENAEAKYLALTEKLTKLDIKYLAFKSFEQCRTMLQKGIAMLLYYSVKFQLTWLRLQWLYLEVEVLLYGHHYLS